MAPRLTKGQAVTQLRSLMATGSQEPEEQDQDRLVAGGHEASGCGDCKDCMARGHLVPAQESRGGRVLGRCIPEPVGSVVCEVCSIRGRARATARGRRGVVPGAGLQKRGSKRWCCLCVLVQTLLTHSLAPSCCPHARQGWALLPNSTGSLGGEAAHGPTSTKAVVPVGDRQNPGRGAAASRQQQH